MRHNTCPNCTSPISNHPENGCVLEALIGVIRDQGTKTEAELAELQQSCNADHMWNDVGEIVDRLEDGEYGTDDEEEEANAAKS